MVSSLSIQLHWNISKEKKMVVPPITPYKVIRIPGIFPCGIRNPALWISEFSSGILLIKMESTTWNPESKTVLGYLTSGDTKPDQQLEVTFIKHYSSIALCFYSMYVA